MKSDSPQQEEESGARIARLLLRHSDRAALATLFSGVPYASLVLLAADLDGSPILLLSDLAQATRNLKSDPRASLMVSSPAESGRDPLDSPRLTLLGQVRPASDPRLRARFLARQPESALYADFRDFNFYRIAVERAHFIGGFGVIRWIDGPDLLLADAAQGLAASEPAIVEQMNRERNAEIDLCVNRLAGRETSGWQLGGIDPDGIDLRRADETARLDFPAPARDEAAFRATFADLVATARRSPVG